MEEIKTLPTKKPSGFKRFFRIFIIVLLLAGVGFFAGKYYFVFGEGTKAGQLNFFVKKGYLFKTYEGRIIQTGYKSNVPGSIQSNEFDFSVVNEKVARILMSNSGAMLELHYKEYLGAPAWRGMSKYIVDSIISVHRGTDSANPMP
jgi:hypothetical protein